MQLSDIIHLFPFLMEWKTELSNRRKWIIYLVLPYVRYTDGNTNRGTSFTILILNLRPHKTYFQEWELKWYDGGWILTVNR